MYQFGGNQRANDDRYGRSRDFENRSGHSGPQSDYSRGDSYRPGGNGGNDFTFRYDAPPGVDFSQGDKYRPREDRRPRPRDARRNAPGGRGRGGYRGRGPTKAADRPMLNSNRAPTPDLMPGMDEEDKSGVKFRAIEDMSDSDETDMDVSSDDEEKEEQPRKKQARTEAKKDDGDSVPRWSNPDPYTALPPPDESQRKKKDVVKLIRKARVVPAADDAPKPEAAADDFISFDFGDDIMGEEDDATYEDGVGVPGAPTGPRFSHRDHIQAQLPSTKPPHNTEYDSPTEDVQKTPVSNDQSRDSALGSRKRNANDEIKRDEPLKPPPFIAKFRSSKQPVGGNINREWRVTATCDPTPWCQVDHSATENMGLR
jgi:non-canonical poly(A) RNA polymerase PAPD5/7